MIYHPARLASRVTGARGMTDSRSCIIIDQHPVVRIGLCRSLDGWDCDEAADVDGALEMLRSYGAYDAAIIGLGRQKGQSVTGVEEIRRLRDVAPGLGIVARCPQANRHAVEAATGAGATGFISLRADSSTVRKAVTAVVDGNRFVDPVMTSSSKTTLTRRQIEVLQHLADGASTEQTAKRLGLSPQTVRTHTKGILSRLDAHGRAHAVAVAIRAGLIE